MGLTFCRMQEERFKEYHFFLNELNEQQHINVAKLYLH